MKTCTHYKTINTEKQISITALEKWHTQTGWPLRLKDYTNGNTLQKPDIMPLTSKVIKKHRFKLFRTCRPYKIITNGYGQLKRIELSNGKVFTAREVFKLLKSI